MTAVTGLAVALACGAAATAMPPATSPALKPIWEPAATASQAAATGTPARPEQVAGEATPTPTLRTRKSPTPTPRFSLSQFNPISDEQLETEMVGRRFAMFQWRTNFNIRDVDFEEIVSGGPPKDGIPAIREPVFETVGEADLWLADQEPVQFVELNGDSAAYPLQILVWHELAQDTVGGVPVVVTYCPLCNTGVVFKRTLEGRVLDFGACGNLRFSNLIMFDRQTESWWQQVTGRGIVGDLTGQQLEFVPSNIISWGDLKRIHPDAKVLGRKTGYVRDYGTNPYHRYDTGDSPFLYDGPSDGRLPAIERVVAVDLGEESLTVPFSTLALQPVINIAFGGRDLAVFFKQGTVSALDSAIIAESRDVGATGVFDANLNGRKLTFGVVDGVITDAETGSIWNILGRAETGPLAGTRLEPVVHGNHFWFSWAVFKPDTFIYSPKAP